MNCSKCGNILSSNEQFCGNCGQKVFSNTNSSVTQPIKEKKNSKKNFIIIFIILLLLIILGTIGIVIFNKKGNIFSNKTIINISYDKEGNINLDDATNQSYYYPDDSSYAGKEENIDVFKINNYVSVYESNSWGYSHLEFSVYDESKDPTHTLNASGYIKNNIGKIGISYTTEERVDRFDYEYDEELISEALKTAPSIYDIAIEYSKDKDNTRFADKEPVVKKINDNISRVDITQTWGAIDYEYFINFDGNKYYIITVSCNPVGGCNNDSKELNEILNTFEKIKFNVKK